MPFVATERCKESLRTTTLTRACVSWMLVHEHIHKLYQFFFSVSRKFATIVYFERAVTLLRLQPRGNTNTPQIYLYSCCINSALILLYVADERRETTKYA